MSKPQTASCYIDLRMRDGSRHFADLPEKYDVDHPQWHQIHAHVAKLGGSSDATILTDDVTEAWISFRFQDFSFSINNQHNKWWFFVDPPECPDAILEAVNHHFEKVLDPHVAHARAAGPLAKGSYRAMVFEADGRLTHHDFANESQAKAYAIDAASESENGPVSAYVVNSAFFITFRGRHY
jgi:hypothetical protein